MKGRVYLYFPAICGNIFNGRALSLCASITKWAKNLKRQVGGRPIKESTVQLGDVQTDTIQIWGL